MRVSPYDVYRQTTDYNLRKTVNDNNVAPGKPVRNESAAEAKLESEDEIITRKERDFFIQMFPQSSEQLEKHVVFNRNGKLQTSVFGKGRLVDSKA